MNRHLCAAMALAIVAIATPAQTLLGTEEVVSGRNATTRVWENVYEIPVLDPEGEPTGEVEEVRGQYIELATGLCYDARPWAEIAEGGAPNWQPTFPMARLERLGCLGKNPISDNFRRRTRYGEEESGKEEARR